MTSTKQKLASIGALAVMMPAFRLAPTAKAAAGPSDPQIVHRASGGSNRY